MRIYLSCTKFSEYYGPLWLIVQTHQTLVLFLWLLYSYKCVKIQKKINKKKFEAVKLQFMGHHKPMHRAILICIFILELLIFTVRSSFIHFMISINKIYVYTIYKEFLFLFHCLNNFENLICIVIFWFKKISFILSSCINNWCSNN